MAGSIAVVFVNYGSHRLIAEALDAAAVAAAGIEVVVVDNFTTGAEQAAIAELCAERGWTLETIDRNVGFGAAVNRGVAVARARGCRTFITLNPDARADARVLGRLGDEVAQHPRALVSPRMVTSQGEPHFHGFTVSLRTGQIRRGWIAGDADEEWKNWLSGACLAFGESAFDELGGFASDFFLYWEDVDLSRRAAEAGMELRLRDDLTVVHDEGGTQTAVSTRAKTDTYYYFNTRNRLLFGARHLQGRALWRWLAATPRQSCLIWLRGGRRQLFEHPAGAVAAVRGTVDGLIRISPWGRRRAVR